MGADQSAPFIIHIFSTEYTEVRSHQLVHIPQSEYLRYCKTVGKIFIYQIPSTCCMERLAIVIPIQQQKPSASGLPPVLISLMIFVFRPTALMARTMKNLLSVFSGVNTSADTPAEVAIVVITEARTK